MRSMNGFLVAGALFFLGLALFTVARASLDPDHNDSVRGLVLFATTPLFPAMMGLVLIVAGFAAGFIGRLGGKDPRIA